MMPTSLPTFSDQLLRTHAALLTSLEGIKEALHSPAETLRYLLRLRGIVLDHFIHEEEGGYMAPVLRLQPQQERTVRALLGEHRRMAEALDALVLEAGAAKMIEDEFRERVQAWAKELRRHEANESALVEEAFNRDVGQMD
jgi:hemerythrin HHE cation binding domain-containing protein